MELPIYTNMFLSGIFHYFGTPIWQQYMDFMATNEGVHMQGPVANPGFPRGGCQTLGGTNLLFGQFFPKAA